MLKRMDVSRIGAMGWQARIGFREGLDGHLSLVPRPACPASLIAGGGMRVAFFGLDFHARTGSSRFLLDLIERHATVETFFAAPDVAAVRRAAPGFDETRYDAIIIWQLHEAFALLSGRHPERHLRADAGRDVARWRLHLAAVLQRGEDPVFLLGAARTGDAARTGACAGAVLPRPGRAPAGARLRHAARLPVVPPPRHPAGAGLRPDRGHALREPGHP